MRLCDGMRERCELRRRTAAFVKEEASFDDALCTSEQVQLSPLYIEVAEGQARSQAHRGNNFRRDVLGRAIILKPKDIVKSIDLERARAPRC